MATEKDANYPFSTAMGSTVLTHNQDTASYYSSKTSRPRSDLDIPN
jgi:hypothetical protein